MFATPELFCHQYCDPVAVNPAAPPSSTCTTPAPAFSPGTPMARSALPSPLTSPAAMAEPNASPGSWESAIPAEFCVQYCDPVTVRPEADPKNTCTTPAPSFSPGDPTARSERPSPLKSPRTGAGTLCPELGEGTQDTVVARRTWPPLLPSSAQKTGLVLLTHSLAGGW